MTNPMTHLPSEPDPTAFIARWRESGAAERAAEEAQGIIRRLRPAYQSPETQTAEPATGQQAALLPAEAPAGVPVAERLSWPDTLPARAQAVRAVLAGAPAPAAPDDIAAAFEGRATSKRKDDIKAILETLAALGQAREAEDGRFVTV